MAVSTVKLNGTTLMTVNDTTATASDVAQGKYYYGADGVKTQGTSQGGGGGGDVDMPIFTFVWDDNWETKISATCNKTYSECSALLDQGVLSALEVDKNESGTEEYTNSLQLMSSGSEFVYSSFNGTTPYLDVHYSRNGTVSAVLPSEFTETLNITQNGTYYKEFKDITEVNVNVPTPTPTLVTKSITANGTYNASSDSADGYSSVTVNVPTGGGGGSVDDVIFIDYDGTVLHSYSASEFQALTAMPSNPTHSGLTAQGWNWSLSDAKAQVTAMGRCIIGQMYVTDDNKTRLYCHFVEGRLHPYLGICPNGTVTVDWGDGSATETLTGTSLATAKTADHEYAAEGDYVITLSMASGTFAVYGTTNMTYLLRKDLSSASYIQNVYSSALYKVELGSAARVGNYGFNLCRNLESITMHDAVTIDAYAFYNCYSLASIAIPNNVTSIGAYAFNSCYSLASIAIPSSVTSIGAYAFQFCYSLASIPIPNNVTSIGNYAFYNCYSLASIPIPNNVTSIGSGAFSGCYSLASIAIPNNVTSINNNTFYDCYSLASISIPNNVTSIGSSAFYDCYSLQEFEFPTSYAGTGLSQVFRNCYSLARLTIPSTITSIATYTFGGCFGMAEYHFLSTIPPTLGNTNAFTNIQTECKIYVPYSADHSILEAYQTATNWSTYASYMVEEEP